MATSPGRPVNGTRDMALFQTAREGDFQYDIPLKPGNYELHLYFAELIYGERNPAGGGETSRLFHVDVNGKRLLSYFDIISDAGGPNMADERVFKDISPAADGKLHLKFTHAVRDPILNAIRISPAAPNHTRPIRIVMREQAHTDAKGNLWEADHYYQGGLLAFRPRHVDGTDDPGLYLGERFGHLTYMVPVPPGFYTITMKFAENWFGPGKPVGGGNGSRRFDIFCNGVVLARNFDIFREAGGADRALDRTFRGLQPNAQGKLIISLVPIENYASIHALCRSSTRGCKLGSQRIFEGRWVELQLIEYAVEEHFSRGADQIHSARPGLEGLIHGIIDSIHHGIIFDRKLAQAGSRIGALLIERGCIGLLDAIALVGRALPGRIGMSFANVHQQKQRAVVKAVEKRIQRGHLRTKLRARVAAENQYHGLLAAEGREPDRFAQGGAHQLEIGRFRAHRESTGKVRRVRPCVHICGQQAFPRGVIGASQFFVNSGQRFMRFLVLWPLRGDLFQTPARFFRISIRHFEYCQGMPSLR